MSSTFQYCKACNNILYPEEDKVERVLYYTCRICGNRQLAETNCVYRRNLRSHLEEEFASVTNLEDDPTLLRTTSVCPRCNFDRAAVFQSHSRRVDTKLTLLNYCLNDDCHYFWSSDSR